MKRLELNTIMNLSNFEGRALISIYMPTFRAGIEVNQNRIILKNRLNEVEKKLSSLGYNKRDIDNLLKPANRLVDETIFWQYQEDGLAIFLSDDFFTYFSLPVKFKELSIVSNRFYIRPLLKYFTQLSDFYILTLSQEEVNLYEATPFEINKIEAPQIDELVRDFVPGNELHQEATSPKGAARGFGGRMHSLHELSKTEKIELSNLFRNIDKGVCKLISDTKKPLIIYSVEYIYSMYKEVSSYKNILDEYIKGSPIGVKPKEVHEKAVEIYSKIIQNHIDKDKNRLLELKNANPQLVCEEAKELVKLSYSGNVETLFVAEDYQLFGKFDEEKFEVEVTNEEVGSNTDLLDYIALKTLFNGGKVYVMEKENLPVEKPISAILRY
ncbi:MAG: hypothetical protein H5T96_02940 [Tissierellales bacterium]|nr:hypothetical protein [Tissierellales bacterium]